MEEALENEKSLGGNLWKVVPVNERLIESISQKYQLPYLIARLLYLRGVQEQDIKNFIDPKLQTLLPDPSCLKDMDKATMPEVVVAPDYEPEVIDLFKDNDDIKLVKLNTSLREYRRLTVEEVILTPFGALVQDRNNSELDKDKFKVVTREKPTAEQIEDAVFAWKVVKHAKTNAVVIARDFKTVAIAQGQTNSISAVEHALNYACDGSKEAVLASDSMLTAEDCIYSAVQSRIGLIIQPGGSIRDQQTIDFCNDHGIAMVVTGIRHFKH